MCPIDIWMFSLIADDTQLATFQNLISNEELQRAQRLRFADHQRRAIISSAILRQILSRYLPIKPEAIVYAYNEFGKPYIESHPIHFNLSHSHDQAIVAISTEYELGIDIERQREKIDIPGLVRKVYSAKEQKHFAQLNSEDQTASFYKVWTCKEAILKALGTGLHHPLAHIEVEIDHKKASIIKEINPEVKLPYKIALQQLDAPQHFYAHLAIVLPKNACKNFEIRYSNFLI